MPSFNHLINVIEFEGDNLLAHPTSFYTAGFEASATAIAFVLYDLARHPEHQDVLYNEMQTHLSGKELTMDLINELSFLDCVITESLRLHPPLPVTDRIATKNYEVGNTSQAIEHVFPYVSSASLTVTYIYIIFSCQALD